MHAMSINYVLFMYNKNIMGAYIILLRGVNVGGKNIVSMAALKQCLENLGFANVSTYIASGNVIVESNKPALKIKELIETALTKSFTLDSKNIKVLVLSHKQLQAIVEHKPQGFGEYPVKYHSDAIFLMDITPAEAIKIFTPHEGVDKVWRGDGVIYSERLSAKRTQSRLSKIMASPLYKSMTIRNWNTTIKLLGILDARDGEK